MRVKLDGKTMSDDTPCCKMALPEGGTSSNKHHQRNTYQAAQKTGFEPAHFYLGLSFS